jgi:FAD/FMN-containing dehydrogenase
MKDAGSARKARLTALMANMPAGLLTTAEADVERYSHDWTGDHHGLPLAVARPRSTEEVSLLLAYCSRNAIGVVPQGGLTGLVGAAVATTECDEIVVSLDRMTKIRTVNPIDYAMVVEAGCILEDAKRQAEQHECILPITFGAQGSCRIGGNVATNAGGFNVLRYGMTRDLVLGLEVVLSDGRVWNGLKMLRKDNRGYDLKQLFIGSEGTLGIITAVSLKLFPKPSQVETALVGLGSVDAAMELYARARRECSDLLTAFELILRGGIEIALAARSDFREPFEEICPVYVLIEVSAGGRLDLHTILEDFLIGCGDLVANGALAASRAQAAQMWLLREVMVETQGRGGRYLRTDVSVPISSLAGFVRDALSALAQSHPDALAVTYGHIGDGNIHLNIVPPVGMEPAAVETLFHETEAVIFAIVDRYEGSLSAEHGIGRVKQRAFLQRLDSVSLDLAVQIKKALDPAAIMNIGRLLPPTGAVERGDPTC